MLWGVPFVLLVALGLRLTSAAEAASIAPTIMPVFAGVFAFVFMRQSQGPMRWIGYAAILAGLACLLSAAALNRGAPDPVGVAALVGAGGLWAAYTLIFRASGLTATQAAALICIWSAALFLPVYLFFGLSRFGLLVRASAADHLPRRADERCRDILVQSRRLAAGAFGSNCHHRAAARRRSDACDSSSR
jgi:drug/metabolite transporter (DMT)-like permease